VEDFLKLDFGGKTGGKPDEGEWVWRLLPVRRRGEGREEEAIGEQEGTNFVLQL
jgi:hypothetical protein